mgnify:FL=1
MHIITGILLTGLLGKALKKEEGLPRLAVGPVQVAHFLPGRVRFRVPSLKGDRASARMLEARLAAVTGVREAAASVATGSVLIHYSTPEVEPVQLLAAVVRLLGLEEAMQTVPEGVLARELGAVRDSLNEAVYQYSSGLVDLPTVAGLALLAVGVQKLVAARGASLPTGFTLVWWAVHVLGRGRNPQ